MRPRRRAARAPTQALRRPSAQLGSRLRSRQAARPDRSCGCHAAAGRACSRARPTRSRRHRARESLGPGRTRQQLGQRGGVGRERADACRDAAARNTLRRSLTVNAVPSHAMSRIALTPPTVLRNCAGGLTWKGRSASTSSSGNRVAGQVGELVLGDEPRRTARSRRERRHAELPLRLAPSHAGHRQVAVGQERMRVGVGPGDQLAAGDDERLDRESALPDLERAVRRQAARCRCRHRCRPASSRPARRKSRAGK